MTLQDTHDVLQLRFTQLNGQHADFNGMQHQDTLFSTEYVAETDYTSDTHRHNAELATLRTQRTALRIDNLTIIFVFLFN